MSCRITDFVDADSAHFASPKKQKATAKNFPGGEMKLDTAVDCRARSRPTSVRASSLTAFATSPHWCGRWQHNEACCQRIPRTAGV